MIYAKIFPILTLFQSLETMTNKSIEIVKNSIGTIENEDDDEIVPFKPSMEYAKMTWSNGIIRLQKYSVRSVDIIA